MENLWHPLSGIAHKKGALCSYLILSSQLQLIAVICVLVWVHRVCPWSSCRELVDGSGWKIYLEVTWSNQNTTWNQWRKQKEMPYSGILIKEWIISPGRCTTKELGDTLCYLHGRWIWVWKTGCQSHQLEMQLFKAPSAPSPAEIQMQPSSLESQSRFSLAECGNSFFRYTHMLMVLLDQKPNQKIDTQGKLERGLRVCL